MTNKLNKIIPAAIIALLVVILGGVIWSKAANSNKLDQPIKIGLSAPLTGEAASWGQNALAGAELAVKEINDKGGIDGQKVELIVEDDKAVAAEGVSIFTKLTSVDNVAGILGPVASSVAGPALPIAQQSKTPVIMIASAPHLTEVGNYIFQVFPNDAYQGKNGAEFMINTLKVKKVAMIYTQNDYGQGLAEVFKAEFTKLGGELVYESGVPNTADADFKTELSKVKNSGAEAVFIPLYPANAITLSKQAKELNIHVPLVGVDTFSAEELISNPSADGVIYSVAKTDLKEDFAAKINALPEFTNLKVAMPALFSYDSAKIMMEAIAKVGTDKAKLQQEIAKTKYNGVSNYVIEFENGKLKNADFEMKVIKNKASVPYIK